MECGTDFALTAIHFGVLLHIPQSPTSLIVVLKMARLYYNDNELYLKCGDCEVVFRHSESDCVDAFEHCLDIAETKREFEENNEYWDSPCCHRRYSLFTATDANEICAVITHGYKDRKSRDKILTDKGIDFDWVANG